MQLSRFNMQMKAEVNVQRGVGSLAFGVVRVRTQSVAPYRFLPAILLQIRPCLPSLLQKKSRKICTVHFFQKSSTRFLCENALGWTRNPLQFACVKSLRKVRSKMASKRAAAIAAPDLAFVQPPNSFIVKFSALIRVFWNKNKSTVHKCKYSLFRVGFSLKNNRRNHFTKPLLYVNTNATLFDKNVLYSLQ